MDIANDGIFYVLKVSYHTTLDENITMEQKAFSSKWDAIKALRNMLKVDPTIIPNTISLQSVSTIIASWERDDIPFELIIRGMLWTDEQIPADML